MRAKKDRELEAIINRQWRKNICSHLKSRFIYFSLVVAIIFLFLSAQELKVWFAGMYAFLGLVLILWSCYKLPTKLAAIKELDNYYNLQERLISNRELSKEDPRFQVTLQQSKVILKSSGNKISLNKISFFEIIKIITIISILLYINFQRGEERSPQKIVLNGAEIEIHNLPEPIKELLLEVEQNINSSDLTKSDKNQLLENAISSIDTEILKTKLSEIQTNNNELNQDTSYSATPTVTPSPSPTPTATPTLSPTASFTPTSSSKEKQSETQNSKKSDNKGSSKSNNDSDSKNSEGKQGKKSANNNKDSSKDKSSNESPKDSSSSGKSESKNKNSKAKDKSSEQNKNNSKNGKNNTEHKSKQGEKQQNKSGDSKLKSLRKAKKALAKIKNKLGQKPSNKEPNKKVGSEAKSGPKKDKQNQNKDKDNNSSNKKAKNDQNNTGDKDSENNLPLTPGIKKNNQTKNPEIFKDTIESTNKLNSEPDSSSTVYKEENGNFKLKNQREDFELPPANFDDNSSKQRIPLEYKDMLN